MEELKKLLKELVPIVEKYKARQKERMDTGFNLFYLVSDYYYRETFHSDIIAAILDPKEKHENGKGYIDLFIDMINKEIKVPINKDYYTNSKVSKEYGTNDGMLGGRIDIFIEGSEVTGKKHCIVIENKLNNAGDTKEQLPKYYRDLDGKGFEIDAFVYLPLDPNKRPDKSGWGDEKKKIDEKLVIVPAYIPRKTNLIDNWLTPAEKEGNDDAKFVIKQYIRVLNNLTIDIMDNTDLISTVTTDGNIDTTLAILKNQTEISKRVWSVFINSVLQAIASHFKIKMKNVDSFINGKNGKILFERDNFSCCFAIENNNGRIGYGIYCEGGNDAKEPLWGPEDRMNNQWPYGYKYLGEDGTKRSYIEDWYNIATIEQLVKESRMDFDQLESKSQIGKEFIEQLNKFKKI